LIAAGPGFTCQLCAATAAFDAAAALTAAGLWLWKQSPILPVAPLLLLVFGITGSV
jgi:hypothetical protein